MKKPGLFIQSIAILAFMLGCLGCSQTTKKPEFKLSGAKLPNTFLLGSHLCRFPMPSTKEMFADMENLKKHGFNLIKIQTHWAVDEPLEGKYEFEKYDSIVQHAKDLGLYVYMGFTLEQAPIWLYQKYPGSRMVGRNGLPVQYESPYTLPSDGKPGPCFDQPDAMAKQIQYIQAFVKHFAKYENILVWNTWQEIAYWAEGPVGSDVCYCENTQQHFREWLKTKYGTLENLNRCWSSNFGDWKQVGPHRQSPIGLPPDKDFRIFMENEYVAQTLKARYMAIKESDPLKRTVFAHKSGPAIGSGQDWTLARCEDFMGSSSYPAWGSTQYFTSLPQIPESLKQTYETLYTEMWNHLALNFDYIRSANRDNNPVWAAEFQGGPVMSSFQKGRVPSAADMRRWMLTTIGSGATAISFWVTRAEIMAAENNGFSLLDSKGDSTVRFSEATRIGKALQKYPDLFGAPTKPKSKVGIIINEDNYQFCKSFFGTDQHLTKSIAGWYHLLWKNGYPVDFVNSNNINELSSKQYPALILPFPISLSDQFANQLKAYVAQGGNLICEGAAGRMNENSIAVRGEMSPVIAKMAGVEQKSFTMVREPKMGQPNQGETWLNGVGDFQDIKTPANFYIQTFNCKSGTPIFKAEGEVTAVENKFDLGTIWLFGTFIGDNGMSYYTPELVALVNKFMHLSRISPQKVGNLLVQKRISSNQEAWIITNPTDADITESIDVSGMKNPELLIGDRWETSNGKAKITLKSLDVMVIVFGKI